MNSRSKRKSRARASTHTGESAATSPENFDQAIGRKIARENARNKIWGLEGYLLREKLHDAAPCSNPY